MYWAVQKSCQKTCIQLLSKLYTANFWLNFSPTFRGYFKPAFLAREKRENNSVWSWCMKRAKQMLLWVVTIYTKWGNFGLKSNRSQMSGKSLKSYQGTSRGTPLFQFGMESLETPYHLPMISPIWFLKLCEDGVRVLDLYSNF